MALKITATVDHVVSLAADYGRLADFGGRYGWRLLVEAMEELSEEMGEDMEVDIVAWCCDYYHATTPEEVFEQYETGIDSEEWKEADDEERLELIREYLSDNTQLLVWEEDCIIWADF